MSLRNAPPALLAASLIAIACRAQPLAESREQPRIVSIAPNADEILARLCAPDSLVAVTEFSTKANVSRHASALATGRTLLPWPPDVETLVALRPTVLVVPFEKIPPAYERILATGARIVSVRSPPDIGIRARLAETYRTLLRATGCDRITEANVGELLAQVPSRGPVPADAPTVLYVSSTGWTAGAGTDIDEVIALAGGQNAAAGIGIRGEAELAAEVAAAMRVDYLLLDRGLGQGGDPTPAVVRGLVETLPASRVLRYHLFDLMAYDVDFLDVVKALRSALHAG